MAEDELTSKIILDVSDATRNADDFNQRLASLEKAFVSMGGQAKKTGEQIKEGAGHAKEATGVFGKLGEGFEKLAGHSRTVGIALEQVGLGAEAGAAKLSGLAEVFKGLGNATPILLGVGAAVTGIFAAFEAGKEAVDKAGEWQANMQRLGIVVKNQGGDWNKLSKEVTEFAELQERTTTYSRDQVVAAISDMTARHIKLADAQNIVRVAEDAAAATHKSLSEVTGILTMAEEGRTRGLIQLGLLAQNTTKQHITMNQALKLIEDRMGGSASGALDTYSGRMQQLQNVFESLQEEIGMALLPALTKIAESMVHFVESATDGFHRMMAAGDQWGKDHKQILSMVTDAYNAVQFVVKGVTEYIVASWKMMTENISGIFDVLEDILEGKWDKMWKDIENIFRTDGDIIYNAFGDWGRNFIKVAQGIAIGIGQVFQDMWKDILTKNWGGLLHLGEDAGRRIGDAIAAGLRQAALDNAVSDNGSFGTWGEGSDRDSNFNPAITTVSNGNQILGGAGTQKKAKHTKDMHDEQAELAVKIIENEANAHKKNSDAIRVEYESLELLLNSQKMSSIERQRIIALVEELKNKEAKLGEELKKQAEEHYTKLMTAEQKRAEEFIKHLDEMHRAHQITYAQMTIEMNDYLKKGAMLTKDFYQHIMDLEAQWTEQQQAEDEKRAKELQTALDEFQKKYDEFYKNITKAGEEWSDKTAGFVEELFGNKGKKKVNEFAQAFKDMLKEMEIALLKSSLMSLFMGGKGGSNFGDTFSKNFSGGVGKSSNPIVGLLGMALGMDSAGGTAGGGSAHAPMSMLSTFLGTTQGQQAGGKVSAASAAVSGGMSSGILGAIIGTSAASQVASSLPTDSLLSLFLGVSAPSISLASGTSAAAGDGTSIATGGGSSATSSALSSLGGVGGALSNIGGLGSMGKGLGSISSFLGTQIGGTGSMGAGLGTIGSAALGGLGGYLVGTGIGKLFKGSNDANLGGAAGGIAGSIMGPTIGALTGLTGPIGLIAGPLIGSVLGSLVGGLFGSHDVPANMPDKYDTSNFGNIETDLTGQGGNFNGTYIDPSSQFMSASGGQSGVSWIEKTLAQYANPDGSPGPNTPAWLKSQWSTLVGAFGISATGSGKMNYAHNINEEWVTGAQGASSNQQSYQALGADLDNFYQDYMTQGSLATAGANTTPYNFGTTGSGANSISGVSPFGAIQINLMVDANALTQLAASGVVSATVQAPFTQTQTFSGISVSV